MWSKVRLSTGDQVDEKKVFILFGLLVKINAYGIKIIKVSYTLFRDNGVINILFEIYCSDKWKDGQGNSDCYYRKSVINEKRIGH